mmetsp:Transcript_37370/g.93342  ORF Transcript_37370/g.93342 Transcript_37370/m.93342 type:complete len:273 (+) Transcript_37370:652-1470(+)|eukprot:52157-Prymnesium_polylepis.1
MHGGVNAPRHPLQEHAPSWSRAVGEGHAHVRDIRRPWPCSLFERGGQPRVVKRHVFEAASTASATQLGQQGVVERGVPSVLPERPTKVDFAPGHLGALALHADARLQIVHAHEDAAWRVRRQVELVKECGALFGELDAVEGEHPAAGVPSDLPSLAGDAHVISPPRVRCLRCWELGAVPARARNAAGLGKRGLRMAHLVDAPCECRENAGAPRAAQIGERSLSKGDVRGRPSFEKVGEIRRGKVQRGGGRQKSGGAGGGAQASGGDRTSARR